MLELSCAVAVKLLGHPQVEWRRFKREVAELPLSPSEVWREERQGHVLHQPGQPLRELRAAVARVAGVPAHSVALVTLPRVEVADV